MTNRKQYWDLWADTEKAVSSSKPCGFALVDLVK